MNDELFWQLMHANYRRAIETGDRQAASEIAAFANLHDGCQYDENPTMLDRAVPWQLINR